MYNLFLAYTDFVHEPIFFKILISELSTLFYIRNHPESFGLDHMNKPSTGSVTTNCT